MLFGGASGYLIGFKAGFSPFLGEFLLQEMKKIILREVRFNHYEVRLIIRKLRKT